MIEISAIILVANVIFSLIPKTWQAGAVTAGIMIIVSYIAWGVAPRTLGRQHADRVACAAAGPIVAITTVLGPFPRLLIMIGNALTPGKGFTEGPFATEAELRELVDLAEASEVIESGERKMIHSVFDLGDTIAREVMVPRTDMVFIEEYKTLRQAVSLALRSGFSRIPVIRDGIDDVVGVLYLKDVIRRIYDKPDAQSTERVGSMMRKPVFCPDSKPVDELLQEMQAKRVHLVIVVDEFGGTAGMVTIEDILEEIVGEITDEYDEENTDITQLGEGRYRVSSRLPVDELGELFGLELDRRGCGNGRRADGQAAEQGAHRWLGGQVRRTRAGGRAVGWPPEQDRDRDRHQDLLGGIRGGRPSGGGYADSLRAGARIVSGAVAEEPLVPEDPEDLKLITLARAALARGGAKQGACVRDTDGRTYAATSVHLEHLKLSAIAVAVAMAVSSGAGGIEAVALLGEQEPSAEDLEILRDLSGDGVTVWWADGHGTVLSMIEL